MVYLEYGLQKGFLSKVFHHNSLIHNLVIGPSWLGRWFLSTIKMRKMYWLFMNMAPSVFEVLVVWKILTLILIKAASIIWLWTIRSLWLGSQEENYCPKITTTPHNILSEYLIPLLSLHMLLISNVLKSYRIEHANLNDIFTPCSKIVEKLYLWSIPFPLLQVCQKHKYLPAPLPHS